MSVTYPEDRSPLYSAPESGEAGDAFVPVYARTRTRKKRSGVRSWMILAPVGVLVLGGVTAMMLTDDRDATPTALAEPAATAPVLPAAPAALPAPVARDPAPAARSAPARRSAPAARRAAAAEPAPAAAPAPAAPAATPTVTLNTAAPEPAAPTAAPPPQIVVAPLD
jgi:hypothetical protein